MSEDPVIRDKAGRFPPGVSGNPKGRARDEDSIAAQLRAVLAEVEGESGKTKARLVAEKWVALGLDGNPQALAALADRVDGKPAQSLTLRGESTAPLHVRHSARLEQEVKPAVRGPDIDMTELPSVAGPDIVVPPAVVGPPVPERDPDHPAPDVAE